MDQRRKIEHTIENKIRKDHFIFTPFISLERAFYNMPFEGKSDNLTKNSQPGAVCLPRDRLSNNTMW